MYQIAQAIELRPEIAGDFHQPGNVTIQCIENHRQKNQPAAEHDIVRGIVGYQTPHKGFGRIVDDDFRRRRQRVPAGADTRCHSNGKETADQVRQREQRG